MSETALKLGDLVWSVNFLDRGDIVGIWKLLTFVFPFCVYVETGPRWKDSLPGRERYVAVVV